MHWVDDAFRRAVIRGTTKVDPAKIIPTKILSPSLVFVKDYVWKAPLQRFVGLSN